MPKPRRRPFPRWLILFFLMDAIVVAAILYWIFGSDDVASRDAIRTPHVGEVQGAPIDAIVSSAAPDADVDDDGFSEWDDSDEFDDEWTEPANDVVASQVVASGAGQGDRASAFAFLMGSQKDLPRPTITKPEYEAYLPTSFEDIGNWKYVRSWATASLTGGDSIAKIPASVFAWNGKQIAIQGFMQPLDLDGENHVKRFMLMRNQAACCYGAPITLADWIDVTAPDGKVFDVMLHKPITVLGKLEVGEKLVDDFAVSVFRLAPDKVLPPGESP